jgi:hypothetical protein
MDIDPETYAQCCTHGVWDVLWCGEVHSGVEAILACRYCNITSANRAYQRERTDVEDYWATYWEER